MSYLINNLTKDVYARVVLSLPWRELQVLQPEDTLDGYDKTKLKIIVPIQNSNVSRFIYPEEIDYESFIYVQDIFGSNTTGVFYHIGLLTAAR